MGGNPVAAGEGFAGDLGFAGFVGREEVRVVKSCGHCGQDDGD